MILEGVRYYRFRVTFRLRDGRRRRWTRWSPGFPWVREEVARELDARYGADEVREQSCRIRSIE